jgi:hypothetical protein
MSSRSLAGAVLMSVLSAGAIAAQDLDLGAVRTRSIARPEQISLGLLGSTFGGSDAPNAERSMGFLAAVQSGQQLRPGVDLELGLGVSRRGSSESSGSFTSETAITNVEVPVLVRMNADGSGTFGLPQRVSIFTGVQGDVVVGCNQTMTSSGYKSSAKCTDQAPFDVQFVAGVGLVANAGGRRMTVDVAVTNGFVAVFKNYKVYNRSIDMKLKVPLKKTSP